MFRIGNSAGNSSSLVGARREIVVTPFVQLGSLIPYSDRQILTARSYPSFDEILERKRPHSASPEKLENEAKKQKVQDFAEEMDLR